MNSENNIYDIITRQFTGEATEAELQRLDEWLNEDPKHRIMLSQFMNRSDMKMMYSMPRKHRSGKSPMERKTSVTLPVWVRYAAAVAIVFCVGATLWWHLSYHNRQQIAVAPDNAIKVTKEMQTIMDRAKEVGKAEATIALIPKSEQESIAEECGLSTEELLEAQRITTFRDREYWVRLCDGSMVHINGGTRLIYPEHFYGHTRDVYIEGEAYFMIAEDRDHPFVVHTPDGNIKELGTEFNVSTRKTVHGNTIHQTEVVLVKGSIAVSVNGNDNEHKMQPGEMAVITNDGHIGLGKVDIAPYVAWNTGTFSFKDKPLGDVMEILSKWYDVDINFHDDKMRATLITGTFDRYETIENILSGIGKSIDTEITLNGSNVHIHNR